MLLTRRWTWALFGVALVPGESIVSYAFGFQNPSAGAGKSIVETRAFDDRVDFRARTFGASVDHAEFQDGFFGAGPGQTIFSIPRTGPDSFEAHDVQLDANQTQALWNVNFLQTRLTGPGGPAAELAGFAPNFAILHAFLT